tara:strand:- start:4399 stop:5994 length:1596 start_codon:yes stop_codon:yes gene_type:complete
MAYLDGKTHADYYKVSGNYGNYQFVSLEDIINQFMVVYVGDEKLISKASRVDVAFWAQRNLAELSFDTFKSIKAQQIDVPPSLSMILPHDYVNYTQLSWVDGSGVKHPLYSTNDTSNPFQITQNEDLSYSFPSFDQLVYNNNFSQGLLQWATSADFVSNYGSNPLYTGSKVTTVNSELNFRHSSHQYAGGLAGVSQAAWQAINVEGLESVNLSAKATTLAASQQTWTVLGNNQWLADNGGGGLIGGVNGILAIVEGQEITVPSPATTIRVGISSTPGDINGQYYSAAQEANGYSSSLNFGTDIFDIAYIEWTAGDTSLFKQLEDINVSEYDEVYLLITSNAPWTTHSQGQQNESLLVINKVDDISVINSSASTSLKIVDQESSTFKNYKSSTSATNVHDDYEDDTYWPNEGERYGLDPAMAQVNGSFYIDNRLGKINFSSNISGKTVILDYVSDSLGTEGEMQVHKFAEDAMYKSIFHDIMSTKRNVGRGQVMLYKKDKFAAVRKAKLRLSNLKPEDLTRVLRGKSKQIKH